MKAKVLFVSEGLGNGGTEKVMMNYAKNIDKNKVEIQFLILEPTINNYVDFLKNEGFIVNSLKGNFSDRNDYYSQLQSFFSENKFDVVHIHTLSANYIIIGHFAKKFGSKSVIFHSHISNMYPMSLKFRISKLLINAVADYKFACSKVAGDYMYYGKYNVLNNAIDLKSYEFNQDYRTEIRKKHGIADDTLLLGNIGRLNYQKNQKYILDIVKELKKTNPNTKALIVGSGELENELREYAAANGIEDSVIFALDQMDAYKYYSAFDVLVFPSIFEGLSLVLVEAQANGLPIVYSECLTNEAKMLDNVKLLPNDKEHLTDWVKAIIDLRSSRLNNTSEVLKKNGFDIKTLSNRLEKLYIDIANNKKLRRY